MGGRLAQRALKTYERALAAFEAHRYAEARGQLVPLAREYGDVSAVHDLLGLCLYREEKWKQAAKSLEEVRRIDPGNVHNHAVLADCYRALGDHEQVKALWEELADSSPSAEAVAEGRIVYAGSLIDQGRLDDALELLRKSDATPKRVEERHLRLWYVLADIHDRLGDIVAARKVFTRILQHDADFADVAERLSVLGD